MKSKKEFHADIYSFDNFHDDLRNVQYLYEHVNNDEHLLRFKRGIDFLFEYLNELHERYGQI